jgi:hypothetical protein
MEMIIIIKENGKIVGSIWEEEDEEVLELGE